MRLIVRSKGFTLIELLVVISIIALLVAILLPLLSRTKRTTLRTTCAVQVRTLAQMSLVYSVDNNSLLPDRDNNGFKMPVIYGQRFRTVLDSYGLRQQYVFCPDGWVPNVDAYQQLVYAWQGGCGSYGYFAHQQGSNAASPKGPDTSDDIRDQFGRRSILFADSNRYDATTNLPHETNHPDYNNPSGGYAAVSSFGFNVLSFPPEGLNIAYIGGEVAWLSNRDVNPSVVWYDTFLYPSYYWGSN